MSAIDNTPTNKNFLSPLNFKFVLMRAPHINFFVQSASIPGISLPPVETPSPLLRIPFPGDHVSFDDLSISFKVDEDLQDYVEIHNWMRGIGKASYEEHQALSTKPSYSGKGERSDISLTILKGNKTPNYQVIFQDAFPTSLTGLDFDTTREDVDYLEATATFTYVQYQISKLTA